VSYQPAPLDPFVESEIRRKVERDKKNQSSEVQDLMASHVKRVAACQMLMVDCFLDLHQENGRFAAITALDALHAKGREYAKKATWGKPKRRDKNQ